MFQRPQNKRLLLSLYFLVSIIFWIQLSPLVAQERLTKSRISSEYTYVYSITPEEALILSETPSALYHLKYLYNLVDSFPTYSIAPYPLNPGHYIKRYAERNEEHLSTLTLPTFVLDLFNNSKDLCVQVRDLKGNTISNAQVILKHTPILYDANEECYVLHKSAKDGLLQVSFKGFTEMYHLKRKNYNSTSPRESSSNGGEYENLIVLNKPKYQPGDTVRFKAFIAHKDGTPLSKKNLVVWIEGSKRNIKLAEIKPYRNGAYTYAFSLEDSLHLSLDTSPCIYLKTTQGEELGKIHFDYEDYELNPHLKLQMLTSNSRQYFGTPFKIKFSCKDENGLKTLDGQLHVVLKAQSPDSCFEPFLFVPHVLLDTLLELKSSGETVLELSDDLFPKANLKYNVLATLQTTTHELDSSFQTISYFYHKRELSCGLNKDAPIVCQTLRTDDSVFIQVQSLRNIPFNYTVLRGNTKKWEGKKTGLRIAVEDRSNEVYYIVLNYIWGGEVNTNTYKVLPVRGKMSIRVSHPSSVYPGQRVPVVITVKDRKGKPMQDVDITAVSYSGKFHQSSDIVPSYVNRYSKETAIKSRKVSNFSVNKWKDLERTRAIDYSEWKQLASLDSIVYYQFLYPEDHLFRYDFTPQDSNTQFAPFAVAQGVIQPVYIVYVDNKPVYSAWNSIPQPYTFRIDSGYHQIGMRTGSCYVSIDSLYFHLKQKTIFSVNLDSINQQGVIIEKRPQNDLQDSELNLLKKYTFSYFPWNANSSGVYLENQGNIQLLDTSLLSTKYQFGGPVVGHVLLHYADSLTLDVDHDPNFTYAREGDSIKRYAHTDNYMSSYLEQWHTSMGFDDHLLTKDSAEHLIQIQWNKMRNPNWVDDHLLNFVDLSKELHHDGIATSLHIAVLDYDSAMEHAPRVVVLRKYNQRESYMITSNYSSILNIDSGCYQVRFYYTLSRYVQLDSISIHPNGNHFLQFNGAHLPIQKDSSRFIEKAIAIDGVSNSDLLSKTFSLNTNFFQRKTLKSYKPNRIFGVVENADKEPLWGATVLVAGTDYGTLTDSMGCFSLRVSTLDTLLDVSYVGYSTQGVSINKDSTHYHVKLVPGALFLGKVSIKSYQVVQKRAILGSVAYTVSADVNDRTSGNHKASRESRIDDSEVAEPLNKPEPTVPLKIDGSEKNSIRNHYSDNAFFQPKLTTNKAGQAFFEGTYPDDITLWKSSFYAIGKKQFAETQLDIPSFKSIMGELFLPRFLIVSDTSFVQGKVLNYTPDTLHATTFFEVDGQQKYTNSWSVSDFSLDQYAVIAPSNTDSLHIKYYLKDSKGYEDGEEKPIPVYSKGMEESVSHLYVLGSDTSITIHPLADAGSMRLYARVDYINVIQDEIDRLVNYPYNSNEQLASKLIGFLSRKRIAKQQHAPDSIYDANINGLIKQLIANRKSNGLWGWWKESDRSYWVSLHILETLNDAKALGFKTYFSKSSVAQDAVWDLENKTDLSTRVSILRIMDELGAQIDYRKYVNVLNECDSMSFTNRLEIIDLKQRYHLTPKYNLDSLMSFKKETIWGNVYFSANDSSPAPVLDNNLQNNLLMYKIIRRDSSVHHSHAELLKRMRLFFLENKTGSYSTNTYESSQIIETILPELLAGRDSISNPRLYLSGEKDTTITQFPFTMEVSGKHNLQMRHTGSFPVYLSSYQHYWNDAPSAKNNNLSISTQLSNENNSVLQAGAFAQLIVTVDVKSDAQYVMIDVPIPGGCSYGSKEKTYAYESHREYLRNKTMIFCEQLPAGHYAFKVNLVAKYKGNYFMNPAKIEWMYFPIFNANTASKRVIIK